MSDRDTERARGAVERELAMAQLYLKDVLERNSTMPVRIAAVTMVGARWTRASFLTNVLNTPLNKEQTVLSAVSSLQESAARLKRFGIYDDVLLYLDRSRQPGANENDIDAAIHVREKSRLFAKTGVDVGNNEGSSHASVTLRNAFGGAETVEVNAVLGTRTRSSYELRLETPVNANPDLLAEVGGYASTRDNSYASHEEVLKGAYAKLRGVSRLGLHELSYNGIWRQITGLKNASPTVRAEAGDSVKSSILHTFVNDQRDDHLLPTRGTFFKATQEIAGGALGGDTAFVKGEVEGQSTIALNQTRTVTIGAGVRGGLLWSLDKPSRLNDRFQMGGPSGVRGFMHNGMGPRDGNDSVGGDAYLAAGLSMYLPLPRTALDSPLRLQVFANGGSLLSLDQQNPKQTLDELLRRPSIAAGFGLVYRHPVARCELNFCLPLVARENERTRKGLQFGVGISFL